MTFHNLPPQFSPFVGRDRELAEIGRLLANPECRLLTLAGPGGIGKTRLALEVTRKLNTRLFPDGVYFVPLQPLNSLEFIVLASADALRLHFYPGDEPKQQLLDYLREKSLLLILDNVEHLLDGIEIIGELLAHAPGVKVLTTSRERLNLLEEWVFDVGGLSYPASEAETDVEPYHAVQLFLQHARRVNVGFVPADSPAIICICRLVGGMPLALELAATWVRVLTCAEIAAEIERSLDILETPARNAPARHRNMRIVLEHSWALLTDVERDVFKRLSVFRGGFRKEAAGPVAGATLPMLSALVDKSLLRVNMHGRYDLHDLLRQYAEEKLNADPAARALVQDQHSAYYAEFMFQRRESLRGYSQKNAIEDIEAEIDNVRAAWQHAVDLFNWREMEKYLWSQMYFYYATGRLLEGEAAFERAIKALQSLPADDEKDRILGQLYTNQAFFSTMLGQAGRGRMLVHTGLAILRRLDAQHEMLFSLIGLGAIDVYLGNYNDAAETLREAEMLARKSEDRFLLAYALGEQTYLNQVLGRFEEGTHAARQSITILKELGEHLLLANVLQDLGKLMQAQGKYQEAKDLFLESLEVANNFSTRYLTGHALCYLGQVSYALYEDVEASLYFHRALQVATDLGVIRLQLDVLLGMTEILSRQGDLPRIVEYLAFIVYHPASKRETLDRAQQHLDQLAAHFLSEDFEACQQKRRTETLSEVLASIYEMPLFSGLRTAASDTDARDDKHRVNDRQLDSLTGRELDVLRLIAEGLSNQEIADHLILGVGTIKWYVSGILSKLDVANRTQAVARARSLGLLT